MKKLLSISLAVLFTLSCIPATPVFAWNSSRTEPSEITDPAYMWPAFTNGEVVLNKKQGRLPALGWNSWNAFGSGNTEVLTKAMADQFINLELDKVGYEYIVLDDGCYRSSRVDGKLSNDTTKFPSGFKAMSTYMHDRGLKFGMYNDIGTNLCAGAAVGTVGYEDVDTQSYTDWGVDFLKVDNCYYLWDNATFSDDSKVQYAYAPRIKSITVSGNGLNQTLTATTNGTLLGSGATRTTSGTGSPYVGNIGTADGTTAGRDMDNPTWAELGFNINAPADGTYDLVVKYASGTSNGVGRWLQVAVGPKETEKRFFDNLLTASTNNTTFIDSQVIKIDLKEGDNLLRLMNHRRQENVLQSYAAFLDGMNKASAGNPDFVLSICEWGKTQPHEWGYKVGNSWRVLNDITFGTGNASGGYGSASWNNPGTDSVCTQYNKAVIQDEKAGLDKGWNDPDMMVIGMNNITTKMSETHLSMWSMMNSPIMLGFDLRRVTKGDDLWKIIANKDVIDLNQDPLGIQAKRIYSSATGSGKRPDVQHITNNSRIDVLAKPLANGDIALSFFNLDITDARSATVDIDRIIEYIGNKMVNADTFKNAPLYVVKNLWTKEEYISGKTFSATNLPATDNLTLRISPYLGGKNLAYLEKRDDGNYTANFAISGGSYDKVFLAIAEYDHNNALLRVVTKIADADAPAKLETLTTNEPPELKGLLKVFMWDATTFKPLIPKVTFDVPGANKSLLLAAINKAETMGLNSYTRLSADSVLTALEAAKEIDLEENPSQARVDAVAAALTSALNQLVVPMNLFTKITGTLYGQSGTYGGGRTYNMLFDGNTSTYYDAANGSDGYGGYDVGAGNEVTVNLIRFYPRSDQLSRANGCTFRGSMTVNNGGNTGTLLNTISGVNAARWYEVVPSNTTDKFRYIWFMSGTDSWGNLNEVEFYTKVGVDRSLLDDRIVYAKALSSSAYTADSWAGLQSALLTADSLASDADQSQVDSAAISLKAALNGLITL